MKQQLPNRFYERNYGFTLIEVLVVAAVIGILTGAGIAAYNRFNEKQQVLSAAMEFATELRLVQKKANAGEKPLTCSGTLKHYWVQLYDSAVDNTYSINAVCDSPSSTELKTLSSNTVFDPVPKEYKFLPLNKGLETILNEIEVYVQSINGDYKHQIIVDKGGAITVVGP